MSSSPSSSGSRAPLAALALALTACAHAARAPEQARPRRIALLPMVSLAGVPVPLGELRTDLERRLRARGLDLVAGDPVEQFLGRHRTRRTGGVDGATAAAAQEELGVDAVLLGSVDQYDASGVPRFAMTMRLTQAASGAAVLWTQSAVGAGDDAPGLLGLGQVGDLRVLESRLVSRLEAALVAWLDGGPAGGDPCPGVSPRQAKVRFRARDAPGRVPPRVAVLPFIERTDRTDRPSAGELVAQELARQLLGQPGITVVEPGEVWSALVNGRVVMEGGVNHEAARIALGSLGVDAVVSGWVHAFAEYPAPRVEFTVLALDTWDNRVVWESTSYDRGDSGVWFFDAGRVGSSAALLCGMVEGVAAGLGASLAAVPPRVSSPAGRGSGAHQDPPRGPAGASAQP